MGTVKTEKIKSVFKSRKKAVSASPTFAKSRKHKTANAPMFVIWKAGAKDISGRGGGEKFIVENLAVGRGTKNHNKFQMLQIKCSH